LAEKIVVDTSILIGVLENGDKELFMKLSSRIALVPFVALYEYLYGYAYLGKSVEREKNVIEKLFSVVFLDQNILMKALELDVALSKEGYKVPQADVVIAATAISLGLPLLTRDLRHYPRFQKHGLKLLTEL
jgi:predicted nucleic acid-binding protein